MGMLCQVRKAAELLRGKVWFFREYTQVRGHFMQDPPAMLPHNTNTHTRPHTRARAHVLLSLTLWLVLLLGFLDASRFISVTTPWEDFSLDPTRLPCLGIEVFPAPSLA